ncbi:MAG: flagellar basal body rod protein FlgB [Rhodocyclaceae bacterium]|nr:flagellar basal body rod protein FlgB [Rhodocyclaceae bacterium]
MRALMDQATAFQQNALNVQSYRQEILASNIANADTPHYKAKDIDFRSALRGVLDRQQFGPLAMRRTSARHLAGEYEPAGLEAYTGYRNEWQASIDGNTVEMDVERAAFAENSIHYQASVRFINSLLQGMGRAINGQ